MTSQATETKHEIPTMSVPKGLAAAAEPAVFPSVPEVAFDFGGQVLAAAEAAAEAAAAAPLSSAALLELLLGDPISDEEALHPFGPSGRRGAMPSATALFNAFMAPDRPPVLRRVPHPMRRFQVLARPGEPLPGLEPRPGDLLVRIARGEGWGHVAVVAATAVHRHDRLGTAGLRGEGYPRLLPGLYLHVVEISPRRRPRADRFARRLCDGAGRVLPDTLLLRPLPPGHLVGEAEAGLDATDTDWPYVEDFGDAEQSITAPTPPAGPDSPVADRFIAAHRSRYCTPGQAGSDTCRNLATPRPIRRVVIHALAVPSTARRSGIEAVVAGWQRRGRQASAHYLVDRDGTITQMVREADAAFHTPGNNGDSIGIEHADICNDPAPLTTRLYERSAALVRDIATRHGFAINTGTVAGHNQVNPNHGDPGPYWDWEYYFLLLAWAGTSAASRPIRLVAAAAGRPAAPAGWQVRHRRAIRNDHCASRHDPWGATYWRAQPGPTGTAAELSLVVDEVCTYQVSLWWPDVAGANPAAPVDIEVACLASPCTGTSTQTVTVNQHPNAGRWNDVAVVNVTNAPAEVKVRWRRDSAQRGWILVDGVRLLKIATPAATSDRYTEQVPAAAPSPGSACAYFFKGAEYVRYDIANDVINVGPAAISQFWPSLPPEFQQDLDAVVNWGNGKVYFFKGSRYVRYNLATDRVDFGPEDIARNWPALPAAFTRDLNAAINWGNGKAYFFRGAEYVRYDIARDVVDVGPVAIATNWPALPAAFTSNLDAAINWGNGKAYFFKGAEYVRYDIARDVVDVGPVAIATNWPALPAAFQTSLSDAVNWTFPCNLAELMRSAGLTVHEVAHWPNNGRPGNFQPIGIIIHHTAGNNDLNVVVNGRPGLHGPLANFYVGRNAEIHVVSAGRANHAGAGAQTVLDEVRRGVAPSDTAARRGLPDGPGGNSHFYGFENENLGTGQAWPAAQIDTIARACAALCQLHCWSENRVISHAEWTHRKPDPRGIDMNDFRNRVRSFF